MWAWQWFRRSNTIWASGINVNMNRASCSSYLFFPQLNTHYLHVGWGRQQEWCPPVCSCQGGGRRPDEWRGPASTEPCRGHWWPWRWCDPRGRYASARTQSGQYCHQPGDMKAWEQRWSLISHSLSLSWLGLRSQYKLSLCSVIP